MKVILHNIPEANPGRLVSLGFFYSSMFDNSYRKCF